MKQILAFVLGGGGSRGAMQVGALRALLEGGYFPDLITGASIGAANAAFLAVHGYSPEGIQQLSSVWEETVHQDLLPTNLWQQTMRLLLKRTRGFPQHRIREFAISHGLTPDFLFRHIQGPRLYLVASDLNAGCPVVFGLDPEESLLESTLASMALPPWLIPRQQQGRYLVDGGFVSNLPIEVAIQQGATEIIALDLFNPAEVDASARGLGPLFWKLNQTISGREQNLEIQLAEARGIPVHQVALIKDDAVPIWDFSSSVELIEYGYQLTRQAISGWPSQPG